MKYTNRHNFPEFVQQWLEFDEYDYNPDTISATTLMAPAKAYGLKKQHWDDLEIDIADLIASRYGTAIHDSVEKVKLKDCLQEERLKKEMLGKMITGKFDILHQISQANGKPVYELIDVKSTSVWSVVYNSKEEDYIKQLSIYRYLATENGYEVVGDAKIWMVFTDWSSAKAKKDPDYPQARLYIKEIKLWTPKETEEWIEQRINDLEDAANRPQEEMQDCTDKELWAEEDKWAIMKEKRISAVKLHDTEEEAKKHLETLDDKHSIVHRPGKVKRCKYCTASKFCKQYERMIQEGRIDES
jgi:hypothetical protein